MNDVLLRIRRIFKDSGKNQTEIGKLIEKTPQYIWRILNIDDLSPSESVINDICRVFNVNKEWIKKGVEPIYKNKDGSFTELLSDLDDSDDEFIKNIISVYMDLDEVSKNALRKIAAGMAEKHKRKD